MKQTYIMIYKGIRYKSIQQNGEYKVVFFIHTSYIRPYSVAFVQHPNGCQVLLGRSLTVVLARSYAGEIQRILPLSLPYPAAMPPLLTTSLLFRPLAFTASTPRLMELSHLTLRTPAIDTGVSIILPSTMSIIVILILTIIRKVVIFVRVSGSIFESGKMGVEGTDISSGTTFSTLVEHGFDTALDEERGIPEINEIRS